MDREQGVATAGDWLVSEECRTGRTDDLATVNQIISTLNRAADVRAALDGALERVVDLMGLRSGMIYLRSQGDDPQERAGAYRLAAQRGLPPALLAMGDAAWSGACRCQTLCEAGGLGQAVNVVGCSRLAVLGDDALGLAVHASVALRSGQRTMGILNVVASDRGAFDDRSLALLTNVGNHLGVALERARLYDLVRERRVEEQGALLDLSYRLLGRLDLGEVLSCVVDEARHLLQADACAVLLPDESTGKLRFEAASGWHNDPAAAGVSVEADPMTGPGLVMVSREPVAITDVASDPPEECAWARGILATEGFRAHALVPLAVNSRSVGVLMLDSRVPRGLDDDEVRLLQLVANQGALAIEQARMHREEVERRRLDQELAVAREVQLSLLPQSTPVLAGWGFGVHYESAREIGGDFYDIFPTSQGSQEYNIVVADVADKGVPAALVMAAGRTLIRATATGNVAPSAALSVANRMLVEDNENSLFVTAVLARLHVGTGELVVANAGHVRPLLVSAAGGISEVPSNGIALGVVDVVNLEEVRVRVEPGETVVFYTDGVTDATNELSELYGESRLQAALALAARQPGSRPEDLVTAVRGSVQAFVGGAEQADDLTIFAVGRTVAAPS